MSVKAFSRIKVDALGNSLVVQGLELSTSTVLGLCSIPGWGTKIPQATWCGQKKKKERKKKKVDVLKRSVKASVATAM